MCSGGSPTEDVRRELAPCGAKESAEYEREMPDEDAAVCDEEEELRETNESGNEDAECIESVSV